MRPDLLVGRKEDFTEQDLPVAPLLAVEVLSANTALMDFTLKKAAYERMGVPSYWLVVPRGVSLTVFELDGTTFHYQQVALGRQGFRGHATACGPCRAG